MGKFVVQDKDAKGQIVVDFTKKMVMAVVNRKKAEQRIK